MEALVGLGIGAIITVGECWIDERMSWFSLEHYGSVVITSLRVLVGLRIGAIITIKEC